MQTNGKFSLCIKSIVTAAALILLCIPAFSMTGNIILPIIICAAGSFLICIIAVVCYFPERVIGYALLILMLFWLFVALLKEMILQIEYGCVFEWIEFFYFDKLLMLGLVWLSVSLFYCFKRIFTPKSDESEYFAFFRTATTAFLIFYIFLLVYSFILIRLKAGDYPFRFIPFITIKEYMSEYNSIPYEVFMMFFGNLLYFTPLGYIFSHILINHSKAVKISVNIFFPVIAFTLLEFSQYLFQNGYCEFDDMLMNSIGFWLGNFLFIVLNKIAFILSKRKYSLFWG